MSAPVLSFYGDDLTGSTDAMEALASNGVSCRLFLDPPGPSDLDSDTPLEAIGIAGTSRAQTPDWMRRELPRAFEALSAFGAPLIHYKICSTFDSAPQIGNIGTVLEIGLKRFGERAVPIVAGCPELNRFTAFGNLFASFIDGNVYRIDRHPVMSRHPTTPMGESDLIKHLGLQTSVPVDLIDFREADVPARFNDLAGKGPRGVLIDNLTPMTALAIGRFLRRKGSTREPLFTIGSSGVEYAVLAAMRADENFAATSLSQPAAAVGQLLILSGSASPTTARQIAAAQANGFAVIRADILKLAAGNAEEISRLADEAVESMSGGKSVIIATAMGPGDVKTSIDAAQAGESLGKAGAVILQRLPALRRIIVSGGDTSSFVGRALGVKSLEYLTTFDRGSPLCRVRMRNEARDGMQILFKGGQLGREDLFERVKRGTIQGASL